MARRAKNEGTIYKKTVVRNGKEYTYWEAQVTVGNDPGTGRRIRKTFTGSTQKEVREKMQKTSLEIQNKTYFEPSKATLKEWIELWLSDYCGQVKYLTKKHYRAQCYAHIIPSLGATKLSELTTPQIQSFYNELAQSGKQTKDKEEKEPLSAKSIKNVSGILSKCLNTAIDIGYLRYNPAKLAKVPRTERKEITPLTNEQISNLLDKLDSEPYRNIYKVILFTGLRKGEALGITWDCVDTEKNILTINKQLQLRKATDGGLVLAPLKNDKPRILSVPGFVIDAILEERDIQSKNKTTAGDAWLGYKTDKERKTALVFTSQLGTPVDPRYVYYHYKKLAKLIDVPESRVHDLRHTYAVLALQNGDEVKTVQDNLGHATAAFTLDVYGHTTDRMKEASAKRMQSFIDNITSGQKK